MADPQVLTTLRRKAADIQEAVLAYRKRLDDAENDPAHVTATLRLLELNGAPEEFPATSKRGAVSRAGKRKGVVVWRA